MAPILARDVGAERASTVAPVGAPAGRRASRLPAHAVGGERPIAPARADRLTPGKTEGVDSQCQQILAYPFRMDKVIQAFHGWLTSSILRRRLLTIGGHGLANKSSGYVRKALRMVRTIVGRWKPTGRWRIRAPESWMSSSCRS